MAARKTVHDIFKSMEYEPPNSSTATAKFWMDQHSCSFGFFINGEFVCPSDRKTSIMTDAAGLLLCSTLSAVDEDISRSASSSLNGFKLWSALPCYQRANVLQRLSSGLQGQSQCLTELCEMIRSPCSTSALVRLVQYYTGWAQLRDILLPGWTPLGTVAVVGSDECSLYALWLKVLPALALGNAVIINPGAGTALPSLLMASLFGEAGLPAGVLNIVTGEGVGVKVAQNPLISHVTYSGNRKDGTLLSRDTAGWGAPVSLTLSLSAVCPFIIFESADIDSAVDGVIEAAFKKKREWQWVLFVQESVWDDVVKRLKIRMAAMKCLPLLAESDNSVVDAAVNAAKQQGATVIQPCPPPSSLAQYPPTVLCGVAPSCPCVVSPPPGPVLSALSFRTVGEGITLGNHSPHGQAASIWTEDLTLALECAKSLSVGTVWINSHSVLDPSLSVSGRKESGNCTDGGQEGLFQFLRPFVSSPLHPSSPCSVDYIKFGSTASQLPIPEGSKRADFVPRSYLQLVGGQQCKSDSGSSIPVLSPSGSVLAYFPDGGRKDLRNAVEGAIKIQPGWMKKSPVFRSQSLYSLAECLELRKSDLAQSLHSQTGLSLEDARREVELSISRLCDWAAFCDKKGGEVQSLPQSGSVLSIPEPIGVVGVVLPDRRPLLSLVSLLGAAVAVGSAVVMVPSEKYPLPALEFIQVLQSSNIPGGLVSIITGRRDQLTQAFANHSVIQAIWYWGSQEGCQYLHYTCSDPLKRLWLHFEEREEKEEGVRGARDWALSHPSLLEEVWMQAVQWKSVWIPTA